jgi:hypothetical protein
MGMCTHGMTICVKLYISCTVIAFDNSHAACPQSYIQSVFKLLYSGPFCNYHKTFECSFYFYMAHISKE